jgi:ankyrin repeat protein
MSWCCCLRSSHKIISPTNQVEKNQRVNSSVKYIPALHEAVEVKSINEIEAILENSADASENINAVNIDGISSLHLAVFKKKAGLVKLFLDYGGDFTLKTKKGLTPLMIAEELGCQSIINLLTFRTGNNLEMISIKLKENKKPSGKEIIEAVQRAVLRDSEEIDAF